jgi:hypothetical protein
MEILFLGEQGVVFNERTFGADNNVVVAFSALKIG